MPLNKLRSRCACGGVEYEAVGAPITRAICYCASCQAAGHMFEQLPSAAPLLEPDGGTSYVLYRKDRVRCVRGQDLLREYRLKPHSPTRRLIATCCNTAMFADFTKGHWLSMYRSRVLAGAPSIQMRVMTRDRPTGAALPDDVPNHRGHSGKFVMKLLLARLAMGFHSAKF